MIDLFVLEGGRLIRRPMPESGSLPEKALWIDLLAPGSDEEHLIEAAVGVEVPTRDEMREIEISSRLYQDGDTLYMTATVLAHADTETPQSEVVTFILTGSLLITIRYADLTAFRVFENRLVKSGEQVTSPQQLLAMLLDAVIDRAADILERDAAAIDVLSQDIFSRTQDAPISGGKRDFKSILRRIGQMGDMISKLQESLVTLTRVLTFLSQKMDGAAGHEVRGALHDLRGDVLALSSHATFLSGKVGFLLEATMGLISNEQNAIIKFFSVVAVVFMPPTLVASIYGMNFKHMPELSHLYGYPAALVAMLVAAVAPWLYFKKKGWF